MRRVVGSTASGGLALGPALLLPARIRVAERRVAPDRVEFELMRFEQALEASDRQLRELAGDLAPHEPSTGADLIAVHRALLGSAELVDEVRRLVRERRLAAESAVNVVVDNLKEVFSAGRDEGAPERFDDVEAVANRLLRALMRLPEVHLDLASATGAIALGVELSPIDAMRLQRVGVVGFATERGTHTAHAAIVARTLGIPYVFGVRDLLVHARPGQEVLVDGHRSEVLLEPDEETRHQSFARLNRDAARRHALARQRASEALTLDGTRIAFGANVETIEGVSEAVDAGMDHVGLFRTELLYLGRDALPSEEEQYLDAVGALRAAKGRPVTFRTLDFGGDKLPRAVRVPVGRNPALGVRAIRFARAHSEILRTQLCALMRASAEGPLRVMFPMVAGITDLRACQRACAEARAELEQRGIRVVPDIPIGIMVETPSAVFTADHLAANCDFFSIGTNDLIQYSFAADRQNEDVAYLYHPLHPAVLRAIKQTIDGARLHGRPVSLCGDMAGEPQFTFVLLGLGLRSLSMASPQIAAVKSVVRAMRIDDAEQFAGRALQLVSENDVEGLVTSFMRERFSLDAGSAYPIT